MIPEVWCCISISCIEANAMQCGKILLPMEKAPEPTVAFSSCVDLAVIIGLVLFGTTLRQTQDKLSLRNNAVREPHTRIIPTNFT